MAASPRWKVRDHLGDYVAAFKHIEDAAAFTALLGNGATISERHGPKLWIEGGESQPAAESYDHVANVVMYRLSHCLSSRSHRLQNKGAVLP